MRALLLSIALFGLLTIPVSAQLDRGTITGTVLDPSGAAVASAHVQIRNEATRETFDTVSNEAGQYSRPNLPPGEYQVAVDSPGFKKLVRSAITLRVTDIVRIDLELEVGSVAETVEVTAIVPRLQSESAEVGTALDNKSLINLPLSFGSGGRRPDAFAFQVTPGVTGSAGTNPSQINGSTNYSKEMLVDGASVTVNQSGDPSAAIISPEALQEVKVLTAGLSAEYGRTQTGVFNYVMKSGTNQFHGSAYFGIRNEALNANTFANNFRGAPRSLDRKMDYAASFGGPVDLPKVYDGRNKTFFYFTYERYKERSLGLGAPTRTVPVTVGASDPKIRDLKKVAKPAANDVLEALIRGYTAVLCSPPFLYLEERPGLLSPFALANRLSYFLWNGPPDGELHTAAENKTLRQPAVLRAQANRLVDHPKFEQFVNAFLDYWLDLRKVSETTPDQTLYPDYYLDDLLNESAVRETQLFFTSVLRDNLPVKTLIDSDFAFLNSHLARHYGLPPVDGVAMRKVFLPAGNVRGALLTQASVLKVTANGTTTSPVLRGAWIMERILGDPPAPPPPGVPSLEPDTRGATTIREQLDKHRSVRSCSVCHSKIDPAGFALENFDVLGGWRDRYRSIDEGDPVTGIVKNGFPITFRLAKPVDASGRLATGEPFRDIVQLKKLLIQDERKLARNLVMQFVSYATGSPAGFADREEIERILDTTKGEHYGMRSLLQQITQSSLFVNK